MICDLVTKKNKLLMSFMD